MSESSVPENVSYSDSHEWIQVESDIATIGITDFAQSELGDIVFVELPSVGDQVEAGAAFGVVESVKAVNDVYAPVSGTVVAVNEDLEDRPELVNESPYAEGWMIRVQPSEPGQIDALMASEDYKSFLGAS